jgi:hypothetical protein
VFAASSLARFGHNPGRVFIGKQRRRYYDTSRARRGGVSLSDERDADWGRHQSRSEVDRRNNRAPRFRRQRRSIWWRFESVWSVDSLGGLGVSVQGLMVVNADYQGSIPLMKSPVFHDRSMYIDIQYHYARDPVKEGRIKLGYVPTKNMWPTSSKFLPRTRHVYLSKCIGLFWWTAYSAHTEGVVGDMYRAVRCVFLLHVLEYRRLISQVLCRLVYKPLIVDGLFLRGR